MGGEETEKKNPRFVAKKKNYRIVVPNDIYARQIKRVSKPSILVRVLCGGSFMSLIEIDPANDNIIFFK